MMSWSQAGGLLFAISLCLQGTMHADTITRTIDLGDLGPPTGEATLPTLKVDIWNYPLTDFDHLPLSGQPLSLTIRFVLPPVTPTYPFYELFGVSTGFRTTINGFPDFMTGTSYVIDESGNQVGPAQEAGLGRSDNGTVAIGWATYAPIPDGIRGVHFETAFPNHPGHRVIGASFGALRHLKYDPAAMAAGDTKMLLALGIFSAAVTILTGASRR